MNNAMVSIHNTTPEKSKSSIKPLVLNNNLGRDKRTESEINISEIKGAKSKMTRQTSEFISSDSDK